MSPDTTPASDEEQQQLSPSGLDFPVVGIGASAGGLAALSQLIEQVPADSGMAFVVILHLSPKHASSLHSVLQQVTEMPVQQVFERTPIEANHVYVIPPQLQLSMDDGVLCVSELERPRGRHVAIDLFFRSLAVVHRERAVAIVLTGTGSDGAVGIARVKEQGGVTIAQDPADAEFDGMPRAAIATRMIDFVLPVAQMPRKLLALWANARRIELPRAAGDAVRAAPPSGEPAARAAEDALREIMQTLRVRTGHDFKHYKRATVLRRIERRLQVNALPNLPAYRAHLSAQPDEAQALLHDLLIGVTQFFRDREAFDALEREVQSALFERRDGPPEQVRAWVAACATGEEAYSVAMLLLERAQALPVPPAVQVFATDIDERAVATARAATFPESVAADVAPQRLRQFFAKEGDRYVVRKELRERVLFALHNLLRDPPFSKLDLICCRNLLIYLDRDVHREVLETFHFALRPGGLLFLGSSETVDSALQLFEPVDKKHRIYRALPLHSPTRYVAPVQSGDAPQAAPAGTPDVRPQRQRMPIAELHRRLVEQHASPSALVDADANIVHLSGDVARFLRHPSGPPSHHLPSLVLPELRLELRTAIFQALQDSRSVEVRRVRIDRDDKPAYVDLTVRPVADEWNGARLLLVTCAETDEPRPGDAPPAGGDHDPLVVHLEEELRRAKEQLQLTIEHSETSHEELKASNEELQAINEELRSASEELETSKEELQSINEELITVNHELKMTVEETGKINDDLQNLIASTDIATVFVDRHLAIKRYTPPAAAIFNVIASDVGRPLLDLTHRLDYDRLEDDALRTLQTLALSEREVSSSDGKWYLARIRPYRTLEDRIDGAVLTFVDITPGKLAEQRLRMVADSMKEYAIVTMDLDGCIDSWNPAAERMFGHGEGEVMRRSIALLFSAEDREAGVPASHMKRARERGSVDDERWLQRKDGSRLFVSGVLNALRRDGVHVGYVKIARDLTGTQRGDLERELQETHGEAAHATTALGMRDEFLAVMSHELKNPLNLIQLNAELLVRLPEAQGLAQVARAADIIRRTVLTQAKIIDDLLDLSRLSTGKLTLRPEAVDGRRVVADIAEAMRGEATRQGVALAVSLPDAALQLHADPVRVEQIVWNLFSNAVKFTPSGGTVSARLARDGDFARLDVHDTGRGIAPAFLPRVFDMYKQADVKSRQQGGLGIGLALVKQLAELHGGRVAGASEGEGKGATFTVWLPVWRGDGLPQHPQPLGIGQLRGCRVLVVDDDPEGLDTLRALLAIEGLDVTMAADAAQALQAVERGRFDVVISDIAMPGMDGYQLVSALHARPASAKTPVIALTGYGRAADIDRARAAGFAAHLGKPVTLERLVATLLEVLAAAG